MDAADEQVLARFVDADGRIATMPAKQAKRRIVLEHVARRFEPGRDYPEPEVNDILREVHDDHAALRRYLIESALLEREGGVYRRAQA